MWECGDERVIERIEDLNLSHFVILGVDSDTGEFVEFDETDGEYTVGDLLDGLSAQQTLDELGASYCTLEECSEEDEDEEDDGSIQIGGFIISPAE